MLTKEALEKASHFNFRLLIMKKTTPSDIRIYMAQEGQKMSLIMS